MTSPHSTSKSSDLPEAYTIGWIPFLGTKIFLDSRPLIPRTETEYWAEQAITRIRERTAMPSKVRVLDLFAGSGCIGVAVLKHIPDATVDFGECEVRHLTTIQRNVQHNIQNPPYARNRIFKTNVYNGLPERAHYDFVLANPPYLSRNRVGRVQKAVIEYEPASALFADDDGFALIERTIAGLPVYLKDGGECWVEHEPEHTPRILESASRLGLTAAVHTDQYGQERCSVILKP